MCSGVVGPRAMVQGVAAPPTDTAAGRPRSPAPLAEPPAGTVPRITSRSSCTVTVLGLGRADVFAPFEELSGFVLASVGTPSGALPVSLASDAILRTCNLCFNAPRDTLLDFDVYQASLSTEHEY